MENVIKYLKGKWQHLTAFNKDEQLKQQCWQEIADHYNRRNRYYHNLSHIGNIFRLFEENIALAKNPALIGFVIFYHDVVYDTLRQDNEEQSAIFAKKHLQLLKVKPALVEAVGEIILASKTHTIDPGVAFVEDMALFFDLDLAVLAEEWNDYEYYRSNIRKEFKQYNDEVYKSGRKNALLNLLDKPVIYKTDKFRIALEEKARENVNREISLL